MIVVALPLIMAAVIGTGIAVTEVPSPQNEEAVVQTVDRNAEKLVLKDGE